MGPSQFLIILLLPIFQCASAAVEDGLLENGDFEKIPVGGFPNAGMGEGTASLPSWSISGTVEIVRSGQKQGSMILIVPQGAHAVRLGNDAEIRHTLQLEKGSTYSVTFSAARTCAQLESLNVSVGPASSTVDLQTLYNVEGWDAYAWAFQADSEGAELAFKNPGMEDDPTCGPIIDNVAIKKLFTPDPAQENVVINGDFEEGPWMFTDATLGVLLPTNLDEGTTSLPGWIVESNRAVRYIDLNHYSVPEGKRAIELLSGKEGIISQMVATNPEKQYNLVFKFGSAGDKCQDPLAVMAFAGDQAQNFHYTPLGNLSYTGANLTFTARAERTRVAFYSVYYNTRSDDRSSLCGPVVDEVRVWGVNGSSRLRSVVGTVVGVFVSLCLVLV